MRAFQWLMILGVIGCFSLVGNNATAEESWFSTYNISDEQTVWADLMEEITVLDVDEKERVYLLDAPNGEPITQEKFAGFINGQSAAVQVLVDDGEWALVAGYDMHDTFLEGYVKSSLLKTVKPYEHMGIVIDKLVQRMYIFQDGSLLTELLISTGLPNDEQPYNETASGKYLIKSWVGGFWSDNMWSEMAIRFNGGDLIHQVPSLIDADGTKNYRPFEPKLGSKASHGCVRVQRLKNSDGINMSWLWDNLKKNTKVLIWNDAGRSMSYPDEALALYYTPKGGQYYHLDAYCPDVKDRYLPLTGFTYAELETEPFDKLTACKACAPPMRKGEIDAYNRELE